MTGLEKFIIFGVPLIVFFVVMNLKSSMGIGFRLFTAAFMAVLLGFILFAVVFIFGDLSIQ